MNQALDYIKRLFEQTFDFLRNLSDKQTRDLQSATYSVIVENPTEIPETDLSPLLSKLDELQQTLQPLPIEFPEQKEVDLTLVQSLLSELITAVKSQRLTVDLSALKTIAASIEALKVSLAPADHSDLTSLLVSIENEIRTLPKEVKIDFPKEVVISDKQLEELTKALKAGSQTQRWELPNFAGGMSVLNANSQRVNPATEDSLLKLAKFGITEYDDIIFGTYTDSNPDSLTFKKNGSTIATLNFTYDGSGNCTRIYKS